MWNIGLSRQSKTSEGDLRKEIDLLKTEKRIARKILQSYRSKFASLTVNPFYRDKPLTKEWSFIDNENQSKGRHRLYHNSSSLTVVEFELAKGFNMGFHDHRNQSVKEESIILKSGLMEMGLADENIQIIPHKFQTIRGDELHKIVALEVSCGYVLWTPGLSEI